MKLSSYFTGKFSNPPKMSTLLRLQSSTTTTRFTPATEYSLRRFSHRFVKVTDSGVKTGVCPAYEVESDTGQLYWYTTNPSAKWHLPMTNLPMDFQLPPPWVPQDDKLDALLDQFQVDAGFQYYPAQRKAIHSAVHKKSCLIAGDVGTGKSLMGLTLLKLAHESVRAPLSLMVVPQGVVPQWVAEMNKYFPSLLPVTGDEWIAEVVTDHNVIVTYPEFLFHQDNLLSKKLKDRRPSFTTVIVDEAHCFGGKDSLLSAGLARLKASHRYALTATPAPDELGTLFPVLGWLSHPYWADNATYPEFPYKTFDRDRFVAEVCPLGSDPLTATPIERIIVTLEKQECRPEIPPIMIHRVALRLNDEQLDDLKLTEAGRQLAHLWHGKMSSLRTAEFARCISDTIVLDTQLCVVAARTAQLDTYQKILTGLGMSVARIDGTIPADTHSVEADKFKNNLAQVLLIGSKCAKSYSFPNCRRMFIGSVGYGYGEFWQVLGRCWRVNSAHPVHVYMPFYAGTIDDKVWEYVSSKEALVRQTLFPESNYEEYVQYVEHERTPLSSVKDQANYVGFWIDVAKRTLDKRKEVPMLPVYGPTTPA